MYQPNLAQPNLTVILPAQGRLIRWTTCDPQSDSEDDQKVTSLEYKSQLPEAFHAHVQFRHHQPSPKHATSAVPALRTKLCPWRFHVSSEKCGSTWVLGLNGLSKSEAMYRCEKQLCKNHAKASPIFILNLITQSFQTQVSL
ncbi:hypothetical protein HYPSUDRAFT_592111 [Hypholoma sublateritium FD-334 SS-4]|uniref:Uncharacterized protein n=1 Tax=Hypholoma sublateritium (strain FD-334 SS-4) TaxID=945553 RepID=A0A0D2L7V0_HYPSF|nr:hypothetical protein HYPSUDRAFT_592111 [Hypholoma sublateritium FD-334 SS-4]